MSWTIEHWTLSLLLFVESRMCWVGTEWVDLWSFCVGILIEDHATSSLQLIILGFLKDYKMVIHCMTEDNVAGKILRETRDMCNSDSWAFEVLWIPFTPCALKIVHWYFDQDYKAAKMFAHQDAEGKFINYKIGKGSNSKLLAMLREKHGSVLNMPPPGTEIKNFKF